MFAVAALQLPAKFDPVAWLNVTDKDAGSTTVLGNTIVTLELPLSAPVEDVVNATVQGVTTAETAFVGVKLTPETAVAAVMVTALAGLTAVVSFDVATLNPDAASV